jgi:hypothetical protein
MSRSSALLQRREVLARNKTIGKGGGDGLVVRVGSFVYE